MPLIALRGQQGVWLDRGPPYHGTEEEFQRNDSKQCKVMAFSDDGSMFGYCDGTRVYVTDVSSHELVLQLNKPATQSMAFSPNNTLLATWEIYRTSPGQQQGEANLSIWNIQSGQLVRSFIQKKHEGWCPQWSADEGICARNVNNELQFFENNKFDTIANKLHLQKVASFKLAPNAIGTYHVAAYVPGAKSQPSYVRLFKYPVFGGPQSCLANKSFFKSDRVDLIWSGKGKGLVILTASDTSADSYYGEQGLHYMDIKGESCLVPRAKNGPIYSVEWNPEGTQFCVVYGFMPAKATIYNMKAEAVFDFGTGPRNVVYYNPFGNILCLAGFGNLQGNMEFWDLEKQSLIAQVKAVDSTYFEWSPDGEHVLTATCAPRLRVGNGYKVWHYSGAVIHEWQCDQHMELWEATWQKLPSKLFGQPKVSSVVPGKQEASKKYVPPAMRGRPEAQLKSKYREDEELPSNLKQQQAAQENMSKNALKNKKKREAKKARQQQEAAEPQLPAAVAADTVPASDASASGDPDVDKKIRGLQKKLRQIEQLKEKQSSGVQLEANQIEKLKTEKDLIEQLQQLQFS